LDQSPCPLAQFGKRPSQTTSANGKMQPATQTSSAIMADIYSRAARSALMSRVSSKNTQPELAVRRFLHALGFRYRLHDRALPGCPDLVLRKYRTVVFVNGCFWHHHQGCKRSALPKTRVRFWKAKIFGNVTRDSACLREISALGWKYLVVWECETADRYKLRLALAPLLLSASSDGR